MWFIALALLGLQPVEQGITVDDLERGDVPALARRLLEPEIASRIVGGTVHPPWVFTGYGVTFWEAAELAGPRYCTRRMHFIRFRGAGSHGTSADSPVEPAERSSWLGLAAAYPHRPSEATCPGAAGIVRVQPREIGPATAALDQLLSAMEAASGNRRLPFRISCEDASPEAQACADPRRALAQLRLSELAAVAPAPMNRRERGFSSFRFGAPRDPIIWQVGVTHERGRVREVGLRRMVIFTH